MIKEKEIELLNGQIETLQKIQKIQNRYYSPADVNGWISSTIGILEEIFGNKSLKIREIENIKDSMINSLHGDDYYEINTVNNIAVPILQSCINLREKIESHSTNHNRKNRSLNVSIIQQQSNIQTINIETILKVLQNELNKEQLKDIQDIIDSLEVKENKKLKLVEKLKEFGIDVLSGVISGILTNIS